MMLRIAALKSPTQLFRPKGEEFFVFSKKT